MKKVQLSRIITSNLKKIIEEYCHSGIDFEKSWNISQGKKISIDDEGVFLINETISEMIDSRPIYKDNFSKRFLSSKLGDLIFSYFGTSKAHINSNLHSDVNKLLRTLNKLLDEWGFLIPVGNLRLINLKKFSIGEVAFYRLNLDTFKYLEKKYGAKVKISSAKSTGKWLTHLNENKFNVLAFVKIRSGDSDKALLDALKKVDASLNILRLYEPIRKIGFQMELAQYSPRTIHYIHLKTGLIGATRRGAFHSWTNEYSINRSKLDYWRKELKLQKFNKLLRSNQLNGIGKKILRALHWYGLAIKDEEDVDKVVKLVIALESLILTTKDKSKKQTLADRIAYILGKDKTERKKFHKIATDMYSLRGSIVHDGIEEVDGKDVNTLLVLVIKLIFKMVSIYPRVKTLKEIDERIMEIQFGSQLRGI